jgi:predicted acetylornithine/succinylornithine family transaminase
VSPVQGEQQLGSADLRELEATHGSGVYTLKDIALVRGEGARVQDAEGQWYIDCAAGHGVANVGHAHPAVASAVGEQAGRLMTCAGSFPSDQRAALFESLTRFTGGAFERFFLCNSGTEAVEGALKFARLTTARSGIVAATRAFHGRTMGALSATWTKAFRAPFAPLIPEVTHARCGDIAAFEAAVTEETACVIVEVVQGEGGVHVAQSDFLTALRSLCDERGALLVFDEVQTGFGRTGRAFAYEHFDVRPDLVAVGKAIAGGVPMGAVMIGDRVGALAVGSHGSTFGGNPLACAAANATIATLEGEQLSARSAELGAWLQEQLASIQSPLVREVRGLGLMIGIDLRCRVAPILRELQSRGVLALPAGSTVLRLLPPLVIERAELERVVEEVARALQLAEASQGGA